MIDRGLVMEAKMFGVTDEIIRFVEDGKAYDAVVDIKPYAKSPSGFSCIISSLDISTIPPECFANWAENMRDNQAIIEKALNESYHTVYGKIAYDIIKKYWGKFVYYSAARGQHHTQLGGLLTHTAEVISMCRTLGNEFNRIYGKGFIDMPLLLSAALLHDICKCNELEVNKATGVTQYSIDASLETHIMGILSEVDKSAHQLCIGEQYPDDLNNHGSTDTSEQDEPKPNQYIKTPEQINSEMEQLKLLKHTLASHHGKLEWGSPITPNIPEAMILHTVDNLDADMFKYDRVYKEIGLGESKTEWNGAQRTYYKATNKQYANTQEPKGDN